MSIDTASARRWIHRYNTHTEWEGQEPITICLHECTSRYGGPEEGGWTYRSGYPIETVCIFSEAQALRVLHELHEKYSAPEYEEDTYDICLSNQIAKWYPDRRPDYE